MQNGTNTEIAKQLNETVLAVIGQEKLAGFERAYAIAEATSTLKSLLTPEYMKPIMELQGSVLGFKTDKDSTGGYPENTVKNCLIEAVLMGLQPAGNMFNIIASNTYPTKNGFGYLLNNFPGLSYEIIPELPRIDQVKNSAAIVMNISWSVSGGEKKDRKLELPIKMNKFMGTDAVIGKATRKARAWLYGTITGSEISDGDVHDLDSKDYSVETADPSPEEVANKRISSFLEKAETQEDIDKIKKDLNPGQQDLFKDAIDNRENELILEEKTAEEAPKK